MTEELDQEVSSMCNLSEGILEKGIEAGKLEAAKNLLTSGFEEETVITSLKLSADQIKALKES